MCVCVLAAGSGVEQRRRSRDVPVQTSGAWTSEDVAHSPALRHHHRTSTQYSPPRVLVAGSSTNDPRPRGLQARSSRDGAAQHARRLDVMATQSEQCDFELMDNGPQGTSTPSPTYRQREVLSTAAPAVPSPAAPPPPSGSQSRPVFEPVTAASNDQLPVAVTHAPSSLHSRKPDVISDVNDEVCLIIMFDCYKLCYTS